jgi:hypothetical protein
MVASILTPLQMIAGATLSNNGGVSLANTWTAAVGSYTGTTLISSYFSAVSAAYSNTAANISGNTLSNLVTFCSGTVPALADNTPAAYASLGTNALSGFTGIVTAQGSSYLGSGNITVFAQVFSAAQGYVITTNDYINSSINSQTYLGSTFTTMNSLFTGNLSDVTLAMNTFGTDLKALGQMIDLNNLGNFGSPAALFRQLVTLTNITPNIRAALIQAGLTEASIGDLTNPNINLDTNVQRLAYLGMQNITGTDLEQVLAIFGVTTSNIATMADLLNPVKIFPNSFPSLTVRTYNQDTTSVLRAIYDNNQGTVNSKLLIYLPTFVLTLGSPNDITYERLSRVIPSDQALANKAIQVSLQQIKNINNLTLPQLAAAFSNMQTTKDLPSISALQQAVPASVAAYYANTYATGSGPNGTLVITDLLGAAVGIPFTSDLTNVTTTINSMTTAGILGTLTVTYVRMKDTVDGVYNTGVGNTVVIPAGPGQGTYSNVDSALSALISNAASEVSGIESSYPTQSANLNTNFTDMAASLNSEKTNLSLASIDIANLLATGRGPIMSFVQSLPGYGLNTEQNGPAQFLETVADLNTQGGQAIVACLREGKNNAVLSAVNVGVDTNIPSTPATIPPQANLLPSTYSDAEAANLVVK